MSPYAIAFLVFCYTGIVISITAIVCGHPKFKKYESKI
jgi:hypothetical protein